VRYNKNEKRKRKINKTTWGRRRNLGIILWLQWEKEEEDD
jgi:hypothetical protein